MIDEGNEIYKSINYKYTISINYKFKFIFNNNIIMASNEWLPFANSCVYS